MWGFDALRAPFSHRHTQVRPFTPRPLKKMMPKHDWEFLLKRIKSEMSRENTRLWSTVPEFSERLTLDAGSPALPQVVGGEGARWPLPCTKEEEGNSLTAGGQKVACFHSNIHIPGYAWGGPSSSPPHYLPELPHFALYHAIFLLKIL